MEHEPNHHSDDRKSAQRHSDAEKNNFAEFSPDHQGAYVEENVQLYRILIHNMHYGYALCQARFKNAHQSPDFRIVEVNSAFTNFSFCQEKNLTGQNLHALFPELAAACRFAAISSDGSGRPRNFRVHRLNIRQEFEATVFALGQHRVAIILIDVSPPLSEPQSMATDTDSGFHDSHRLPPKELNQQADNLDATSRSSSDSQKELMLHKNDLEVLSSRLVEANNAISVLARQIDRKRDELEKKIARRVSSQIMPLLEELQQDPIPESSHAKLDVISAYLRSLTPGISKGGDIIISLSPMELRVAMMVKKGFSTEETARMLHLSPETVKTHRRSIRRKLNIRNSPVNLSTYLKFNLGPVRHTS